MKPFLYCIFSLQIILLSCGPSSNPEATSETKAKDLAAAQTLKITKDKSFVETMQKHLDAVSNKDTSALKSTMDPGGNMTLILPSSELKIGVDAFMDYHIEWFQDTSWTFETKIVDTMIGEEYGVAITKIIYREPERNGKPYFHRMTVSYALQYIQDAWYIVKDHASSIEKTES